MRRLYGLVLNSDDSVIFQNEQDRALFRRYSLVPPNTALVAPGSGIDLRRFQFAKHSQAKPFGHETFLFIGRMLYGKGLEELVEATRLIKTSYPAVRVILVGPCSAENRSAISKEKIQHWVAEGVVEYFPPTDDVRPYIEVCDCVVLPSYREGLPRSLLEAAAIGRSAIATDVAGCKDVIIDGVTGLLYQLRNYKSLAGAMENLISMPRNERTRHWSKWAKTYRSAI